MWKVNLFLSTRKRKKIPLKTAGKIAIRSHDKLSEINVLFPLIIVCYFSL
ncbi:hypothetical protein H206_05276 [Candidatus Electrothrix aarhusensis]|uniref:Uncharacterized protein n=1 Tax=Candidatus Electrothrix aarhusensis TaxID=1859131 RepID=A0A3S3SR38_9BACT|nr:hypothetical protein H206_05276 [Candidatus Electrothrix aarhusensis]